MASKVKNAVFIEAIDFRDPNTRDRVEIHVYQEQDTGRYFGIDGAFMIEEEPQFATTPTGVRVELLEELDGLDG